MPTEKLIITESYLMAPFMRAVVVEGAMRQSRIDEIAANVAGSIAAMDPEGKCGFLIHGLGDMWRSDETLGFSQMRDHFMHQLRVELGWGRICVGVDDREVFNEGDNRMYPVSNPGGISLLARDNVKLKKNSVDATAFEAFLNLPDKPECFLQTVAYDPVTKMTLVEKVNMIPFGNLNLYGCPLDGSGVVKLFLDYVEGAIYLAKHELVLCDICPENLGVVIGGDSLQGIFHDLEALTILGSRKNYRLHHVGYELPEAASYNGFGTGRTEVRAEEMTYQLGLSLMNFLADDSLEFRDELLDLARAMVGRGPNQRMPLADVSRRLGQLSLR